MVLTGTECTKKYGTPVANTQPKYIKTVAIPEKIKKAVPAFKNVSKVTLCELMEKPFFAAFNDLVDKNLASQIVEWGGIFNVRQIRGVAGQWSIHSWALAFDINMTTNALGAAPKLDPQIVTVFKAHGFDWGGDFTRKDGMHFQLSLKSFNAAV